MYHMASLILKMTLKGKDWILMLYNTFLPKFRFWESSVSETRRSKDDTFPKMVIFGTFWTSPKSKPNSAPRVDNPKNSVFSCFVRPSGKDFIFQTSKNGLFGFDPFLIIMLFKIEILQNEPFLKKCKNAKMRSIVTRKMMNIGDPWGVVDFDHFDRFFRSLSQQKHQIGLKSTILSLLKS